MSTIDPKIFSLNSTNWLNLIQGKTGGLPDGATTSGEILNTANNNQIQGVSDFQTMLESLSDPSKADSFALRTIEGHVEYNLKAAFQLESGQRVDLELNVKVDFKIKQASAAYEKQKSGDQADYFSPENTSKRIGDFALGFLPAYQSNHDGQTAGSVLKGFFELAKDAIAKGFDQAKGLLGTLYGEKADKTYDLVMDYLDKARTRIAGTSGGDQIAVSDTEVKI